MPPWSFRLAFDWTALLFCSYDVMNDIACAEPSCNQYLNLLIISSTDLVVVLRWWEMETRSGYCIHWHTRKSMIHLNPLQLDILTIFCCCPYRSAIFMSHVPWLGEILLTYPMLIPDYKKFRVYAQARAMRRIKEGASYKDLFHHLVNYIIHSLFRRDIKDQLTRLMRTISVTPSQPLARL